MQVFCHKLHKLDTIFYYILIIMWFSLTFGWSLGWAFAAGFGVRFCDGIYMKGPPVGKP